MYFAINKGPLLLKPCVKVESSCIRDLSRFKSFLEFFVLFLLAVLCGRSRSLHEPGFFFLFYHSCLLYIFRTISGLFRASLFGLITIFVFFHYWNLFLFLSPILNRKEKKKSCIRGHDNVTLLVAFKRACMCNVLFLC